MNGNLEKEKKKVEKRVRREKEEERTCKGQCAFMLKIFNNFISQLSVSFEYIEHNIFLISNNIFIYIFFLISKNFIYTNGYSVQEKHRANPEKTSKNREKKRKN